MEEQTEYNQNKKKSMRWLRRVWGALPLVTFILLLGIIFVLQSWIRSEGNIIKDRKANELAGEKPPVNVVTLNMVPGSIREQINLPGVVQPWVDLTVVAEVRGKIVSKKVTEGQRISSGEVLAEIDKRSYQNDYNSARAAYMAAKAGHSRLSALHKDRLATQSQLDDAMAGLERAKANMDTAALNLERCTIVSPMDGIVDRVYIEKGQFMNDADRVADVLKLDRVKVQVSIPESDVDAVRHVTDFTITVDALSSRVFSGRQHYLAKTSQSLARSYLLEVAVDNPDGEILPDMFCRVTVVKHLVEDGLAVPLFSLVNHNGGKAVYVADNGKSRLVPVKTGIHEGWKVHIVEGLATGDQVIVVGQKDVRQGAPINVLRTVSDQEELIQ